jgi:hypothetical protein
MKDEFKYTLSVMKARNVALYKEVYRNLLPVAAQMTDFVEEVDQLLLYNFDTPSAAGVSLVLRVYAVLGERQRFKELEEALLNRWKDALTLWNVNTLLEMYAIAGDFTEFNRVWALLDQNQLTPNAFSFRAKVQSF